MWKSLALSVALVCLPAAAFAKVPDVVATIQPLHSLAAMVMDGIGEPHLLVKGLTSEHGYALKPSDARALETAQVVVLVDPNFETFMAKPLQGRTGKIEVMAMADLPGMNVLKPREGGVWEPHHHDDAHGHEDHGHEDHGSGGHDHDEELDGHLWLDIGNARLLLVALSEKLAELDPEHAQAYRDNAQKAEAHLSELDAKLKSQLAGLHDRPYVVFHDGYQYFEARYGLRPAGSITVDPDRPVSAKRLTALAEKLRRSKAACVFREPQFPAPIVQTLADAANAKIGVLDPQGASLPTGVTLYPALLSNLAQSLTGCLAAP